MQVNGGDVAAKVAYGQGLFEKQVAVDDVFAENEYIDILGVTKGKGVAGTVARWGTRRLPRKTHRGLRKVRPAPHTRSCAVCERCVRRVSGRVYRCLAPCPRRVLGCSRWSAWLLPPHGEEQVDLPHRQEGASTACVACRHLPRASTPLLHQVEKGVVDKTGSTEFDLTEKGINPVGGFPHYGLVRNDWLLIKGGTTGPKKRVLTLRKTIVPSTCVLA